ncbi:transposase family Tnp2 protein, partial [Rhizoctonia solani AG-3 Rhs1AP]
MHLEAPAEIEMDINHLQHQALSPTAAPSPPALDRHPASRSIDHDYFAHLLNSPQGSLELDLAPSPGSVPRLSAARPRSFFMRTPSPIANDPNVNLQMLSPFGGVDNLSYPDFWSPPVFPSPPAVGSQYSPGSQHSELVLSPPALPPSQSPIPPALRLSQAPTPFQSSQHSRSSSVSSGLANEPIHFADPIDDERFYRDLLDEHLIALPPPRQCNNPGHASAEPAEDYYRSSDDEDEEELGPNPNGSPPRANSPEPAVPAAFDAGANPPAIDDPEPNNPDEPDGPNDKPFAAFAEPARLRNIYIRTYVPSVFAGATKKDTHSTLENIRLALEDAADTGDLPQHIQDVLPKMAQTVRSLRHRLGVDTDDILQTYTLCTVCGKRYSADFIKNANTPDCPRLIGDERCGNPLFTETVLKSGKRIRKPVKSYPCLSIKLALERLLARPGMKETMRGWKQPGHDDQGLQEPSTRQEWLDLMPEDRCFGDMHEAWGWRSQHARMTREYNFQEGKYHDLEPEDGPVSLVSLPNGLGLTIFFDGVQAHEHQKYEVQAVYITVNNIPSHLRTLIENIMLVIVIPGPNQPTAYELDQILEPLVDELLELEQGVEMQVYDQNTRQMVRETVHARLSLGVLDYIARLKLTGHAGVASENHFCLYCVKKLSQLSVRDGYQNIDLRNPSTHLQHKHEWLRAQGNPIEQERLRKRYGTIFTELDRLPGCRQHSRAQVEFAQQLLWRVNTSFVDMNVPLPPTAHLLMHVEEHIQKYGSLYGTSTNAFERANKVLVNINNNGHGGGCMEETMARGFLQRADFFRLIRHMQAIQNPTRDDTATIEVMLRAVRNAPEHEVQRALLDQVLAERIWFPSVSAKVDLNDEEHRPYTQILFDYCAAQLDGYAFYSHVHHAGFRFGSDLHYRGKSSRYGYVREGLDGRTPALMKMIYEVHLVTPNNNLEQKITCAIVQRFVPPEHRPRFPWHHWYVIAHQPTLQDPEAIPIDHLVGVFALSDIIMAGRHYWLTFSMDHSEPEPLED